jgi:hypothetical protein
MFYLLPYKTSVGSLCFHIIFVSNEIIHVYILLTQELINPSRDQEIKHQSNYYSRQNMEHVNHKYQLNYYYRGKY